MLYRDQDGVLLGLLTYFDGKLDIRVEPGHLRQGIGSALLAEAMGHWPDIDLDSQNYTTLGIIFIDGLLKKGAVK
jgi:hypothetical protein